MLSGFVRRLKYRLLYNNPYVWYKKATLAKRILKSAPVPVPARANIEIHVHTCARDFVGLLWALRSFYFFSGSNAASLTVHDDGTLTEWHNQTTERLFPGVRVITKSQSDQEVGRYLEKYPRCRELRNRDLFSMKVFDFPYYARENRLMLLDSDVLFFAKPEQLLGPSDVSLFNEDRWTSYIYSPAQLKTRFGLDVPERLNAGLGVMNKNSFDFELLEDVLSDDGLRLTTGVDQTLIAILGARYSVRLLGPEYKIILERGLENTISKHYVRLIRHLFYTEGIPHLEKAGILL